MKSIIQHVGDQFPRLRIGVGRGDPQWDLADHVLSRFARDERDAAAQAIATAADAVEMFVEEGLESAMNRFNQPPDEGRKSPDDSRKSQVASRNSETDE